MATFEMSEDDYHAATSAEVSAAPCVFATRVRLDRRHDAIHLDLSSGASVMIPLANIPGLNGKRSAAEHMKLDGGGECLSFPEIDLDLSIPILLSNLLTAGNGTTPRLKSSKVA